MRGCFGHRASGSQRADARDQRGARRAAGLLVGSLAGWIAAPPWMTVAWATLMWFGGLVSALRQLAVSAARQGSAPEVVARLERRARSGASVWLVGLAAVGMAAAVSVIGSWYGTAQPALALARLVALALSGYACIGLACWAIVFEVALVV